jgi:hypothetical protein
MDGKVRATVEGPCPIMNRRMVVSASSAPWLHVLMRLCNCHEKEALPQSEEP